MTKRTEITIETQRVLVIRRRSNSVRAWCQQCLAEVELISADEAARLARVSSRTIYRWIEEARLHYVEDSSGVILICTRTLMNN